MKKVLISLVVIGLILGNLNVYAGGNWGSIKGTVRDNNNGEEGYILIHSGEVQGNYNDVGTWVNPENIPTLKGEKGDTGEQGLQGVQGVQGKRGVRGHRGKQGIQGEQGLQGIQGIQGENGMNGSDANVTHRYTEGTENQIDNYGYNDYYSENAFKNNLINEGYSKVYDYDDPNLDLTEVGYFGLTGNPNDYDKDYVLTSEYEKYSSQGQDTRITTNKNTININKNKIIDVDNKHTIWNERQDVTLINHNTRIDNNTNGISNNSRRIDDNVKRLDNHEGRIEDLEDTSYCVRGEVQFVRKENLTVGIYGKTDLRHTDINREVGINIVVGIGKSSGQVKREELEKRIEGLEKKLGFIGVEPVITKNEKGYIVSISEQDKMKVLKRF